MVRQDIKYHICVGSSTFRYPWQWESRQTGKRSSQKRHSWSQFYMIKIRGERYSVEEVWQQYWDSTTRGRHLHSIQNTVGIFRRRGTKKKEQVIICRLQICHSHLNSTLFIIRKHPTVFCDSCHEAKTAEHTTPGNLNRKDKKCWHSYGK